MPILFNLDGTLVEPREGIVSSLRYALEKLERTPPSDVELEGLIGPPLHVSLASLLNSSDDDLVWAGVGAYRENFERVGISGNAVYAGIFEALEAISGRDPAIFVATSKPLVYAQRILQVHGLAQHFRGVYGAELDGSRSEKRELIAHVLRSENLSAERCIMVGDRSHDVIGARSNGVQAVGVLWGFGSSEELSSAGADALLSNPSELTQLVG